MHSALQLEWESCSTPSLQAHLGASAWFCLHHTSLQTHPEAYSCSHPFHVAPQIGLTVHSALQLEQLFCSTPSLQAHLRASAWFCLHHTSLQTHPEAYSCSHPFHVAHEIGLTAHFALQLEKRLAYNCIIQFLRYLWKKLRTEIAEVESRKNCKQTITNRGGERL